jgi:hypothetical protein
VIFLLTLPFKMLGLGFKTGRGTVRLFGLRRLVVFGLGVGVGLLLAPGPGAELRAKLRAAVDDLQGRGAGPTADLVSRVRDELASSPRTWHLPQPSVTLDGVDRVVLAGAVPDDTAKADLERVAAGVKGVVSVDNRLAVAAS